MSSKYSSHKTGNVGNKQNSKRAPIVTIMGHVDHGKTTLLDSILKTKIAERESGGITQHVRSFQIEYENKPITFIDTPGHEAFIAMRERGTRLTDIIILVVAADDGVMPQTKEVIAHWKKTKNHLVVAINKMDLPNIQLDKIKNELAQSGVLLDTYGGDIPFVEISAKIGTNLDKLLELINIVAELNELDKFKDVSTADFTGDFVVLESFKDKFLGSVANVIVKSGEVRSGDYFIDYKGEKHRVRSIIDGSGQQIKVAIESAPVKITGIQETLEVGIEYKTYENENLANEVQKNVKTKLNNSANVGPVENNKINKSQLAQMFASQEEGIEVQKLNLIIVADTAGSLEAIEHSLNKIEVEEAQLDIKIAKTGTITLQDIQTAQAQSAIVIGFNIKIEPVVVKEAEKNSILLREYRVIYELVEEIEEALIGLVESDEDEEIVGFAEVLQVFQLSNGKFVAGSRVSKDKIIKGYKAYIDRNGERILDGKITSLKHLKEDVKEANTGMECGIMIDGVEPQQGDLVVCYKITKR